MLDRFYYDDGVINHDANRQDDAEKREIVDREPESFHRRERADQRNGDRNEGDDRGAPGLEKDQDNQNDQRDCLKERFLHYMDRFADRDWRIVNNRVVE